MSRKNAGASGCINWPTHLRDSGEGGMYVYALVRSTDPEPFSHCCGVENVIAMPYPDVVISHHDLYDPPSTSYRDNAEQYEVEVYTAGPTALATLCLGSSRGSWSYLDDEVHSQYIEYERDMRRRGDDVYWQCREEDLTPDGVALVEALRKLYGRDVELVTYLDT